MIATESVSSELQKKVRTCRDLGLSFLLDRVDEDGRPAGEPVHHARLPWTLAVAGARPEAAAVLSWHEREILDGNGDFPAGDNRSRWSERWAAYPLAMLAMGAWILERYDTSEAIMGTLVDYQDPVTGGAYTQRPEIRSSQRQDLFPTAQLGMTALMTGRRQVAEGCFRWLSELFELQPELPNRLFSARDENGLISPHGEEPGSILEFEVITDFEKGRQAFYNPGIAAAFLGRYYGQTGDEVARDLGRGYLRLSAGGTEEQFDFSESMQICKFGWGVTHMAEVDPEGGHLPNVVRMAEWFIASQFDDGRWRNSPFLTPEPTIGGDMEITAEFVLHASTILNMLAGQDRGPVGRGT